MKACAEPLMQAGEGGGRRPDGRVAFEITADKLSLEHPSGKGTAAACRVTSPG